MVLSKRFLFLLIILMLAMMVIAPVSLAVSYMSGTFTPTPLRPTATFVSRGPTVTPGPSPTQITYYCLQCPANAVCIQICWRATLPPQATVVTATPCKQVGRDRKCKPNKPK